ncbi:MAG TPA: TlpA disulfide reductase family protein [Alphaproteobacteria bacterium]|nr:TlpA disulfide reductase family protein [Alphaproteobacteria bacterium]
MSFWKKKDNLIISAFVVAFFVGLGVWYDLCCVRAAFFPAASSMSALEVPFVDQNQNQLTISEFVGKPLVVNLWATWCPSCVKKMGGFNRFAQKFQEKGGEVLNISQDRGGVSTVRAFYARNGYTFPIYIEATGHLLDAFGGRGLPTSVFIDAQGKEVGRIEGGLDWEGEEMSRRIEDYFGIDMSK